MYNRYIIIGVLIAVIILIVYLYRCDKGKSFIGLLGIGTVLLLAISYFFKSSDDNLINDQNAKDVETDSKIKKIEDDNNRLLKENDQLESDANQIDNDIKDAIDMIDIRLAEMDELEKVKEQQITEEYNNKVSSLQSETAHKVENVNNSKYDSDESVDFISNAVKTKLNK